ncbi:MAG TPA: hypothetical protein VII22_18255, partial [Streptosporangiaceae bacterium]
RTSDTPFVHIRLIPGTLERHPGLAFGRARVFWLLAGLPSVRFPSNLCCQQVLSMVTVTASRWLVSFARGGPPVSLIISRELL